MKQWLGNILDVNKGIIAHQVNVFGVMGAGVAKSLSDKYSDLLNDYREGCLGVSLGHVDYHEVNDDLIIANCFSQLPKQSNPDMAGILTSYDAIYSCFLSIFNKFNTETVYVPFQYGCGIAGGSWPIVKAILSQFPNVELICREEDIVRYYSVNYPDRDVKNILKNMEKYNGSRNS